MKKLLNQLWLTLATALCWMGATFGADIQYVADGVSNVKYCGAGYGISVSVSTPASGYVVRYSTSEEGPWQSEPILYTNACAATPIYFEISAEGYTTVTNSRTVAIEPKELTSDFVWLVLPTEDYVYDGNPKTPDVACGDSNPSIITNDDFDVVFSANVDAGTATATFTGKRNYTGTVTEEFDILQAENGWITAPSMPGWTYGQPASEPTSAASNGVAVVTYGTAEDISLFGETRPSLPGDYIATFTVAESQNYMELVEEVEFTISPAAIQYVADGVSDVKYCGAGYGISVSVSAPASGATVRYAASEEGPWQAEPILYTNACAATPIYFEISAAGYTSVTNSRTVAIEPKELTSDFVWLVLPTEDYVYDGTEKVPDVACGDGNPSIITNDDFDVVFSANVDAGTATATFTGKRNYTGEVTEDFEILKAENGWITEPTMPDWTYGQAASEPNSVASNGTAVVTYGTAASPGSLGDAKPTLPGSYVATFTVAESQNYKELTKDVAFTISPAAIQYVADDVSGEYNGSGYGIDATVSVSAPASGATVRYAASEEGPWQAEPILYTNACAATPIYFEISAAGYATVTNSRTVTITIRSVTVTSGDGDWVYDGQAHSNTTVTTVGFVAGEGVEANSFSTITEAGTIPNAFDYAFAAGTLAENYSVTCVTGTLTVAKATFDDDEEEPGDGDVPADGLSKFDATSVYDGEGHTIDTNALVAAFGAAVVDAGTDGGDASEPPFAVEYAMDDGSGDSGEPGNPALPWGTVPVYTNVGEYVVWYRVTSPNYEEFAHAAKLTITNRPVTVTSGDGDWTYDGQAHSNATVTTAGFVAGEGVEADSFATITEVGTVSNTFDYVFAAGTLAANYSVTCVTGTLTVAKATVGDGGEEPGGGEVPAGGESKFDVTSMYDGEGHTIDTNALVAAFDAAMIGGASVEYAVDDGLGAPALPWMATSPVYTNAGEYVVWYRATNPNYEDFVHAAKVTITIRSVTVTSGDGNWTYDGQAHSNTTVTTEGFVAGEGVEANSFATITEAGTVPNAFDYTFAAGTLAANYSVTCVTGTLTVAKATVGDGGEEPGGGEVPADGLSKFDATSVYDGEGHTIDTNALVAAFGAAMVGDFSCMYARAQGADSATPPTAGWDAEAPTCTNVGEYVVWYRVTSPNYNDFAHAAKVTITPRDIAHATIAEIGDVAYAGTAVEPVPTVADGNPSIITADDYDVSYSGNNAPGQATVTLTGKRNYTGTITANFTIVASTVSEAELLSAEIAWKYLQATGTFFAQLKVVCTNGLEFGIEELRFVFADKKGSDGQLNAALWDTQSRSANQNLTTFDGFSCRYVPLDASLITAQGVDFVFGVSNLSGDSVPVPERAIELYTRKRVAPRRGNEAIGEVDDFTGYLVWKSNGREFLLPLLESEATEAMDDVVQGQLPGTANTGRGGEALFAVGGSLAANAAPYFGVLLDGNGVVRGSVDVSLPKVGSRTKNRRARVKIAPIGERQISFTGVVDQNGFVEGIAAGRALTLEIGASGIEGSYGPWGVACARSRASAKDDVARVVDQLNGKSYGVELKTVASNAEWVHDFSEVSVKITRRGKARITCELADGTKVPATSKVIVPDGGVLCVPVVVRAYRGKKGGFGFLLWIDGDGVSVTGLSSLNTTGAKRPFVLDWNVLGSSVGSNGDRK